MSREERRAAIVHAAIRLFSEHGFQGTTTREVAAAVGVTEPVLYRHFKTKSELYSAIIQTKAQAGAEKLVAALEPHARERNDREFFTRLAEHTLEHYKKDPAFVRLLLFSALERHELAEFFYHRQLTNFHKKLVIPYIRQRMKDRAFVRMDPAIAARAFAGMVHHQALLDVMFGDTLIRKNQKKFVANIVTIFLQGMYRERNGAR